MSVTSIYESLVEPHLDDLRKYCFFLTKSKWDGEDLCQEAILKSMVYFRNKEAYQDVKPFLIRVARNLWIDGCRSLQRQRRLPLKGLASCWYDANYAEVRSLIEWVGERLPARNIEMLLLSDYFGYTMQEIAETMHSTVPAVKSVLFRTRSMLREQDAESLRRTDGAKVIPLDVESWSKAIMRDLPPCL
ncbi:RNA polymerase sigma factor [Cohnella candidum]|uniref:RNA polymerase sigma factor n=1 Tax=Cohnella candidum TaxID=2674991 RepID=UPI0013DDC143|nr:RNA polymerase sigma factor [Cohnella candidum]